MPRVDTTNFVGVLTPDVLDLVVRADSPHLSPLYAILLAGNRMMKAKNEKVEWYSGSEAERRTQINRPADDYTDVTTTLAVDDTTVFVAGDIAICEATGEIMRVQSVNSGVSIVVVRGIGGVAAADASVADNAWIKNIGNAHGEGAGTPDASTATKVYAYNFLQTFRQGVKITGRMERLESLTPEELGYQRAEAFEEVVRDIEYAMFFGARNNALQDADGNKVTTMGGLREMVSTHVTNQGGTMTHAQFIAFCEMAFDSGSPQKDFFCGPTLLTTIHEWYDDKIRITSPIANVGLKIQEIVTPHGNLRLIPHNGFRGSFAGDGVVADTGTLRLRPTEKKGGGKLQLKQNTQNNGEDATGEEIFAEHTLEFGAEKNHAQLRGVTGAA